jgi:hypothetical protein
MGVHRLPDQLCTVIVPSDGKPCGVLYDAHPKVAHRPFPMHVTVRLMQPLDTEKQPVLLTHLSVRELREGIKDTFGIRKFNLYYFPVPFAMAKIDSDTALLAFLQVFARHEKACVLVWENLPIENADGNAAADTSGSNTPESLGPLEYCHSPGTGAITPNSGASSPTGGDKKDKAPPPPIPVHNPRYECILFPQGDIDRMRLRPAESAASASASSTPGGLVDTAAFPYLYRAWSGDCNFFGDLRDDYFNELSLVHPDGRQKRAVPVVTDMQTGLRIALPPSVEAGWSGISLYADPLQALRDNDAGGDTIALYRADAHLMLAQLPSQLQLLQQPGARDHFGLCPRVPLPLFEFDNHLCQLAGVFRLSDVETDVADVSSSPSPSPSPVEL